MKSNFILRKEQNPQQPTRRTNCRSFNAAWLIMFLLSFTLWQCQKDEFQGETTGVCPEVISTDPARNAKDVIANKAITATFNETMNASTVTAANFQLTEGTNSISGIVTPLTGETTTFTFTPKSVLAPFTLYTGTIKKGVKDPMNNMLQEDYSWSFTTQPLVSLSAVPLAGGTITGGGLFNVGTSVTATVVPNPGYVFANWTEAGVVVSTNTVYPFVIAGNRTLVANFVGLYTVTLSPLPLVGGTVTGAGAFNEGVPAIISAVPSVGYSFINWTEGTTVASALSTYNFPVTANRVFVANFAINMYALNVTAVNGSVVKVPTQTTYSHGTSVQLTATPATGFTFTSWSGDATGTTNPMTVNMNSEKNITANFTAIVPKFTVGLSSNPLLSGTTTGSGSFDSGASVTVSALPATGFTFTNWTEGTTIVSTNANYTFNINANKTFVANFDAAVILPSGPAGIDLGSAGDFAILAGSGVSNTGVTTMIKGDVGAFPTATMNGLLPGNVNGILYMAADPIVGLAKDALTNAYNDGQARSLNAISLPGQIGGLTLAPGLYVNSSTSGISGTGPNGILTLDAGGNADAVWIFKVGSTFITDANTSIVMAGGAQAKNIYWSVGTSATLGTNSIFYGNILADQAITLTTGATLYGRALTRIAAVTLDSNIVTKP